MGFLLVPVSGAGPVIASVISMAMLYCNFYGFSEVYWIRQVMSVHSPFTFPSNCISAIAKDFQGLIDMKSLFLPVLSQLDSLLLTAFFSKKRFSIIST